MIYSAWKGANSLSPQGQTGEGLTCCWPAHQTFQWSALIPGEARGTLSAKGDNVIILYDGVHGVDKPGRSLVQCLYLM